jgi:hypothetical protein
VIVGHAKLPSTQKNDREERSRCPSSGRYLARNAAFNVRDASGLARPRHSFAIARRAGGTLGEFGSKPAQLGFLKNQAVFDVPCTKRQ